MEQNHKSICKTNPNCFCNICGQFVIKTKRRQLQGDQLKAYIAYFGYEPPNRDKWWTPSDICGKCSIILYKWYKGQPQIGFSFIKPVEWFEPINHETDCFFCLVNLIGINRHKRSQIKYPVVASMKQPIPRSVDQPIPLPPTREQQQPNVSTENDDDKPKISKSTEPILFTRDSLTDFFDNLAPLSDEKKQYIMDLFRERNLLDMGRKRVSQHFQDIYVDKTLDENEINCDNDDCIDKQDEKHDPTLIYNGKQKIEEKIKEKKNLKIHCTVCNAMFPDKRNMKRHMKIHKPSRPYSCSDCEKSFLSRSDLKRHLLIHIDCRPYGCEFCGRSFTLKGGMDKHIKRMHQDEKKSGNSKD